MVSKLSGSQLQHVILSQTAQLVDCYWNYIANTILQQTALKCGFEIKIKERKKFSFALCF